eukprot:TRINITY_DN32138_c0_g1_i1.p1 TRINITY_DN32138_c0_g1~~TRINITY_DN32138_c0_g1_i1.p1  ORF type:complete len:215 (+),score=23.30 TRINITY_DN32138_c0_g1_i1:418-1062(+)
MRRMWSRASSGRGGWGSSRLCEAAFYMCAEGREWAACERLADERLDVAAASGTGTLLGSLRKLECDWLLERFDANILGRGDGAADAFGGAIHALLAKGRNVRDALAADGGWAYRYAAAELRGDCELLMRVLAQTCCALEHAPDRLRGDRGVVLEAVGRYGCELQHAASALKADREVVITAVTQDYRALQYASPCLRKDRGLAFIALEQKLQQPG